MEQESKAEFREQLVVTSESDLRSAQRKCLIWASLLIAIVVARFCTSDFVPRSWAIGTGFLELALFFIFFIKAALCASKAQSIAKFLRKCRQDSATFGHPIA